MEVKRGRGRKRERERERVKEREKTEKVSIYGIRHTASYKIYSKSGKKSLERITFYFP